MTARPLFSVVICTHNRASYLARALDGVARLESGFGQFEVLVVDNASTDDTRRVVSDFEDRLPNMRYVHEARLGLSIARNTGWQASAGRYVAYLDDDAIPSPNWLQSAAEVLALMGSEIGMLGGQVQPIWEAPRPDWLADRWLGYLTVIDLGPTARFVDEDGGIVGANMIIPRELLEKFGGFSPRVGRIGGALLSNEELLLKRTLAAAGYRGYYDPEVRVGHHAPPERLTRKWFYRRLYWQGRSNAVEMRMDRRVHGWRRPALTARALIGAAREGLASLWGRQAFDRRAQMSLQLGLAAGLIAREPAARGDA
ncbi:MAG: glycosyltransferase [Tsuneonella sp.]